MSSTTGRLLYSFASQLSLQHNLKPPLLQTCITKTSQILEIQCILHNMFITFWDLLCRNCTAGYAVCCSGWAEGGGLLWVNFKDVGNTQSMAQKCFCILTNILMLSSAFSQPLSHRGRYPTQHTTQYILQEAFVRGNKNVYTCDEQSIIANLALNAFETYTDQATWLATALSLLSFACLCISYGA